MSIYEKLLEIQQRLKVPKNQFNDFGKFYYRSCEDILEAVKPLLAQQKTTVILTDEPLMIGQRYYIKATAYFTDIETKEEIKNTAYAREEESKKGLDTSQVTGASSSYARRYALNGLFCIDDNKDSDYTNGIDQQQKNQNAVPKNTTYSYYCEGCGVEFIGMQVDGKQLSAKKEFYERKKRYKKALCNDCVKKMYEEIKKKKENQHE